MMLLTRTERGAAMVFGIFFAVFFVAMVWALWGTIETVLYRQRVQDAADAAAFSAAVVNARGMNLIALINMTMAAVLAVLVALRLAQTLCYIAIGLCMALSSVTMGATSVAVPPLRGLNKGISRAADNVKEPIQQLLKVLHQVGSVTAQIVPLGANARVIDLVASHHDAFGVAIPTRMTLPVEDDDFSVLCAHAGELSGQLAVMPLSPVLPEPARDGFAGAVGKLTAAGSSWFCGEGGSPPDLNGDERTRWVELPRFESQDECERTTSAVDEAQDEQAYRAPCEQASAELLAAVPDRNGRCREGEAICPTDCERAARDSCPPDGFVDCDPDHAADGASAATRLFGASTVQCGGGSAYDRRLALAREQCLPKNEGGRDELGGFAWLERDVVREYYWDELRAAWLEDESARRKEPSRQVRRKDGDRAYPCGRGGVVDERYESDPGLPLCEGAARCESHVSQLTASEPAPCSRNRPTRGRARFRERTTEVLNLLRCAYRSPLEPVTTPPMDISQEFSGSGGDASPFRLEKGKMLGTSDFQLRAVVIGKAPPEHAEKVVALAWHGGPRGDRVAKEGGPLVSSAAALGRFGLAQAEYYFDWRGLGEDAPSDQQKRADVTEWMWNMAWRARLRPFRLNHADADPQAEQGGTKASGGQSGGGTLDCTALPKGAGAFCGDAQEAVKLLGGQGS